MSSLRQTVSPSSSTPPLKPAHELDEGRGGNTFYEWLDPKKLSDGRGVVGGVDDGHGDTDAVHDGEHPSAPYRWPLASDLFISCRGGARSVLKSTVSSRIPSFNIWKDLFSARANWVVSLPCCASACLEPQRTVLRDQCPPALLARRLSAMAALRESARACVRRPSEQSDDDRSSCSSGKFAEITAGASGALRVQDLERGLSACRGAPASWRVVG